MHGHPKLLVVKWLVLSVTVRVSIKARDREWIVLFLSIIKSDKHDTPLSCPPGLRPSPTSVDTAMSLVAIRCKCDVMQVSP